MSEYEKDTGRRLAEAIKELPPERQDFFLGYVRAICDMAKPDDGAEAPPDGKD